MTSRKKEKSATQSTSGAPGRSKKGQTTLTSAWDKQGTGSNSPVAPSPDTSLATNDIDPNVTMTETTLPDTNATDATMILDPCLSPVTHLSPDHDQRSPLKKKMKAADITSPTTVTPPNKEKPPNISVNPPKTNETPRAETPPRSNRRPPSDTRFELRLMLPASSPDDAYKTITDTLAKILVKVWDSDKKARVVPWYNDSKAPLLKTIADIPNTISSLRQYFPRLTPNSKGGTKFTSIRLRLSIPPSTLKEDIDWYLRDNNHGLYLAQIQAETVDTILWLLWSHDMMDTAALRNSIEAHLEKLTHKDIPVGLRWRTIQLDQPGRIPDDEAVKALHIDVARENRNEAKRALEDLYSSTATEWPLHSRMRAVPLLKDVMNGQIKKDIHRLIGRQASFNDEDLGKRKINTWEIKELDFESAEGYTLRDYIMSIYQKDDKEKRLFHSVDHLRFNRSTVVFTCMPSVESEARNMVSSLLTFLYHHFGDVVKEFFTKDAQLRAAGSYWDETEQCVRNEDDAHVSSLLTDLDEDYILPPVKKKGKTPAQQAPTRPDPTTTPLQRNTFGEDEDSIGTFRRKQANDSISLSSINSDSAMSIATLTSRLTALEHLLTTHNIALPAIISASSNTEEMPNVREGDHH
jgi:hypothetical protein